MEGLGFWPLIHCIRDVHHINASVLVVRLKQWSRPRRVSEEGYVAYSGNGAGGSSFTIDQTVDLPSKFSIHDLSPDVAIKALCRS